MLLNPDIKFRIEHFGALAKNIKEGHFFRLNDRSAVFLAVLGRLRDCVLGEDHLRCISEKAEVTFTEGESIATNFLRQKILISPWVASKSVQPSLKEPSISEISSAVEDYFKEKPQKKIVKPFWAHLQPFTRCNQKCIHCYCEGGPDAQPFMLELQQWFDIVNKLDDFGIFDVYVTGGENLLYKEFFSIAEHILSKNLGFGLSTNATLVTKKNIERLKKLNLKRVQVSLDGATPETYKFIRGVDTFHQALKGIERLSKFVEPVINTVVNKRNIEELGKIILLCKPYGINKYKFFPQKNCGRTVRNASIVYSDDEIKNTIVPRCHELSEQHGVEIETLGVNNCGSGASGFAVDHFGDAYPCIFGVEDSTQRIGSILTDDLNEIWFDSHNLNSFRKKEGGKFCHRCETPLAA